MYLPEERITSRHNPLVMQAAALAEKKGREREELFRFDGKKLFAEALAAGLPLTAVLLRASRAEEICAAVGACPAGCRAVLLEDSVFDRLSEERAPEGVICLSKRLDKIHKIVTMDKRDAFQGLLREGRTLVLESVRDPGNLGTAVRSARAFGVANLVLSADCADLYHPRTLRATMGTLFSQYVLTVEDLPAALASLRARGRVFAAALDKDAMRLDTTPLADSDTVVVGNEGHGISAAVRANCTDTVYIPMECGVESLNAGVAASILLWEWYRR